MDTGVIKKVLPIGNEMRLIKPTPIANPCLSKPINTANYLLYALLKAGEQGLSTTQIEERTKMHANTCKCYLRELCKIKLVEKIRAGNNEAVWRLK
jgi:hypothetical protein